MKGNEPIRMITERLEHERYSAYASFADQAGDRDRPEEPCEVRTAYQRDRDRILHCKSFRRLKDKTQVFLSPEGDHFRTRMTHTLEVAQIARTVARALLLNEDLVEAIALGHDLGHTPFGHAGERALNEVMKSLNPEGYFKHNEQSVRLVEVLEKDGEGLNLTWKVRDGMRNHGTGNLPHSLEGQVVRFADKIAYVNHDIDDAIRAGVLTEEDLPIEYTKILGHNVSKRLDTMIRDLIHNNYEWLSDPERIRHLERIPGQDIPVERHMLLQSEEVGAAMAGLRSFMFREVYSNPRVKGEERKAEEMLKFLFDHFSAHPDQLPIENKKMIIAGTPLEISVCDYIAGMTDRFAIETFMDLYVPRNWKFTDSI